MTHSFEVVLEGVDFESFERNDADALYEAGCGDSLPCLDGPLAKVVFDREAASFAAAVASAVLAIESALPHARIIRVERVEDVAEAVLPRSA
jgi:hypothetical protein